MVLETNIKKTHNQLIHDLGEWTMLMSGYGNGYYTIKYKFEFKQHILN